MQDDSDYLGIVIGDGGQEGQPAKAKKPKPKRKGKAKPGAGPASKSVQAQEPAAKSPQPVPVPVPASKPAKPGPVTGQLSKPQPGKKQGIFADLSGPKPVIFEGIAQPKLNAPEASQGSSAGGAKKGIFKDIHLESMKVTPEAPTGCITSKSIFCRLNSPSAAIQAESAKERVPSGVPGLDEMIEGGFERNSNILITGGPGCGKTTFLFQFLVNGATMYEEPGLFISFEEDKEELFLHYKRFGWDLERLERGKKVLFVKYAPHEVAKFIDSGGGMLKDLITDAGVKRIAIDSLTSFSMLFKDEYDKRFNIIKFFDILRTWNCTVMLTAERPVELSATYDDFGLEFLVDAVLLIYNVRKGNIRERAVEVLKMRGTNQLTKLCPLKITGEGVVVFPSESIFSDIA